MAEFCTLFSGRWLPDRCKERAPTRHDMIRMLEFGGGGQRALPLLFLVFTAIAPGGPQAVGAQTVQGQLLDRETLAPIEGALVLLLGDREEQLDGYLTNAKGRFILRAPKSGVYVVRADRIGYETVASDPIELAQSQIFGLRLETAETAIQLEELRVEGEQQCVVRPGEGMEVARAWEEARKALTVQEWTDQEGMYRFQVLNYERDMGPDARRVEGETRRVTSGVARSPIQSRPAAELMEEVFIQRLEDGGWEYYGPDAAVLLSDEFLDTHCFRLRSEVDRPGALGLAFEPVRDTDQPDIEGTLWLDRETAALQFLEFGYTWAEYQEARGVAQGRVEFEGLPNGAWIVRKWWIRMPRLAQDLSMARGGRSGVYVAGIREAGAEVAQISTLDRQRISQVERGFVSGLVWDSTRYGPLEGAKVYLSGTSHSVVTDEDGFFFLEDVREGVFTAAFTHPRLDTLGVIAPGVEVEVHAGDISDILLGVPATGSILLEACRGEERAEGSAVITGVVHDKTSGEVVPRATVSLKWQEIVGVTRIEGARDAWLEVSTRGDGRFSTCGVPAEQLIIVQAEFLDQESDTVHIRVPMDAYRAVDLEIELPAGMLNPRTAATSSTGGVGIQGVQGYLIDPESREPVRAAEVALLQTPGTIRITGTTNDRGFFRMQTRIPGSYALSARALGYSPLQAEEVDVFPGKLTVVEVKMAPEALAMEPIVVTAEARTYHLELQGFYERMTKGLDTGTFITPEIMDERLPNRLTDLFWSMPATRVVETQVGEQGVYFRTGERFGDICWPMVYQDRQLVRTGGLQSGGADPAALNEILEAFDVTAIEVYRSPAEIPPEFNGPNAGCGVIVLWTRQGGSGG